MKKILTMATVAVVGLAVGISHAEDEKGKGKGKGKGDPAKRAEMLIKKLDTDGNGTVSKDEFAAGPMASKAKEKGGDAGVDKFFGRLDKNSDGELDKEELSAQRPGGKGKPGPGGKGKGKGKGDAASE